MHSTWVGRAPKGLAILLLLGLVACARMFMAGSKPAKAPPLNRTAEWTVTSCTTITGEQVPMPGPIMYYLATTPNGLALYEFDSKGDNGAEIANYWEDQEGLHFFTYVKTSHGFELLIPKDYSQPGTRKLYLRGTYETTDAGGVLRPVGVPGGTCVMTPAASNPGSGTAAGAATPEAQTSAGCQSDADCSGELVCQAGGCVSLAPARSAGCGADDDCKGHRLCLEGACVDAPQGPRCQSDANCRRGHRCRKGVCVEGPATTGCQADKDCKGARICERGECVDQVTCRGNDADCPGDQVCKQGVCQTL